ncbi:MAG: ABC transporter permease [Clostridiales bacterium]|nr:ABC transporter permease [Clostridiales bacterium]
MSFPFALLLQCKRIARRKGALACFLLLPLLVLLPGLYLNRGGAEGGGILVGIYLAEGAPGADELWPALREHSGAQGYALSFIPAESPEELADQVAAGVWECGYLFPADFRQRLRDGDYGRLVARIDSPATSLASLINEAASGAILDVCAPDIAISYMKQSGIIPESDPAYDALLDDLIPQFFDSSITLKADIEYLRGPGSNASGNGGSSASSSNGGSGSTNGSNGSSASEAYSTAPALLRGLVAIYLFLFSCLCSLWFIEDRRSGFYRRLAPYLNPGALYLPYFCAAAIFAAAEGLLALLLMGAFFPGSVAAFPAEAFALLLYLAYLSVVSGFLASLCRRQEPLAAALPFLLIACLLFCPILFDPGRFIPFAGELAALLPPTFYMRAASTVGVASSLAQLPPTLGGLAGYLPAAAALYGFSLFRYSR